MDDLKKQVSEVFALQRSNFFNEKSANVVSLRIKRLKALKKWILTHEEDVCKAIYADFKKPEFEVRTTEIYPLTSAIKHVIKYLNDWVSPKSVENGLAYTFSKSEIRMVPKGVCLIISPWNYPFMLALEPVISALAAGCNIVLKPSEFTPHTSQILQRLANEVFKPELFAVFQGDYKVSQELLKQNFDHIFFTGSPQVGKIIMEAAAKQLTSVTLELGGMNPAIIDDTANLSDAAEKILWAKGMNAGQTCVSVNEIYVPETKLDAFISALKKAETKLYPKGYVAGENLACVISQKHFKRINNLIHEAVEAGGKIAIGGEVDETNRMIHPTFLTHVPQKAAIRNEEIFGPAVVITTYDDRSDLLSHLREKPTPLAGYVFSKSRKNTKYFLENLEAGTVCVNDTTIQFAHPELPFGGHNNSGIGKGHGHFGFLEFTNQRAELTQRTGLTSAKLVYPPYSQKWKKALVRALINWF